MNNSKEDPNCVGRIIRILDKKSVITSATTKYVNVGDFLSVYQVSDELYDLDGNSLGPIIFDKDRLIVKQATARYSLCEKKDFIIHRSRALFGISKAISSLATSPLLEGIRHSCCSYHLLYSIPAQAPIFLHFRSPRFQ